MGAKMNYCIDKFGNQELSKLLTPTGELIVQVIGIENARKLFGSFGGAYFDFPKRKWNCDSFSKLSNAIGLEAARALCNHFSGEKLYIPRENILLTRVRHLRFVSDVKKAIMKGSSLTSAIKSVSISHQISDRHGWDIWKKFNTAVDIINNIH
ncbi:MULTISPECIES: Mor transcription activator family protein [Serratia]|uniref:Mor transcription activator family protein n=1 Tax=Serratia TaxID=613 RepID=UPI00157DF626|nr:Mor transcription activator family protein [Serratia marcescens]MBP1130284.1 hypothetical protein [Serratia sp. PL17]